MGRPRRLLLRCVATCTLWTCGDTPSCCPPIRSQRSVADECADVLTTRCLGFARRVVVVCSGIPTGQMYDTTGAHRTATE
jgi:hypothetical protein